MPFVQMYKSSDLNSPVLSGIAGTMITLLNKILLTGYTAASLTSLTSAAGIATATIAVANSTLVTGNYVTISGADQADYNGTFQIIVVNSTTFTFTVPNSPVSPATGTLLYAKAGLGWTSPFTGPNIAVYRSPNMVSNRFYLRVADTGSFTAGGAKEANVTGFETMTDYFYGTGQFPTNIQTGQQSVIWPKSITADSTARAWTVIGDDKTFYVMLQNGTNTIWGGFGHLISFKPGDGFNTFVGGLRTPNSIMPNEVTFGSVGNITSTIASTGVSLARSYTQVGSAVYAWNTTYSQAPSLNYGVFSGGTSTGGWSTYGPIAPSLIDFSYFFLPVFQVECTQAAAIRGRLPGVYHMWCAAVPTLFYDEITNISNMPAGTKLVTLYCDAYNQYNSNWSSGKLFVDFVGPWV